MFHIAAGAALGRTALPQPLHPLTLAVLGDWPEPTLVVAAAALSSPSLCPSPPSSPLRVLPDCSTLYALMSHLSFDGTRIRRAVHLSDLPRGPLPLLWVKYSNTLNGDTFANSFGQ